MIRETSRISGLPGSGAVFELRPLNNAARPPPREHLPGRGPNSL